MAAAVSRQRASSRRRTHLPSPARRKRLGWSRKLLATLTIAILCLLGWAAIARHSAPTYNTSLSRFDAIIVLGTLVDNDGNPSPELLARVTEGVREYERGVAPRLILTGGRDRNGFVEAQVMARTAMAEGIPLQAITEERQAKDTIQNGCYSMRIMEAHGWRSAEVVSSASHLPRAGLIFSQLPLGWRVHVAPALGPETAFDTSSSAAVETLKTMRYLTWARRFERCEP